MKNVAMILSAMFLCTSAFAFNGPVKMLNVYHCDLPKDAKGEAIYGGPGYSVISEGSNFSLSEALGADTGHVHYIEIPFTFVAQEPDMAIYRAQNVTATIGATPINGELQEFVSISVDVGNEVYTAACTK